MLVVACCLLFVVCCWLFVECCLLNVAHLLFDACRFRKCVCLSFVAPRCLMLVVWCLLLIVCFRCRCSSCVVVGRLSLSFAVVGCLPFVVG